MNLTVTIIHRLAVFVSQTDENHYIIHKLLVHDHLNKQKIHYYIINYND